MIKQLGLILLLLLQICSADTAPGIKLAHNLFKFNDIKPLLLKAINEKIQELNIDASFDFGNIQLDKIKVRVKPIESDKVKIDHAEDDYAFVKVDSVGFEIEGDLDVVYSIYSGSGKLKLSGFIDEGTFKLKMNELKLDDPRPYTDFRLMSLSIQPEMWEFNVDITNVPKFVSDFIIMQMKESLLEKTVVEIFKRIDDNVKNVINDFIRSFYPLELNTDYNLVLNTKLVNKPYVVNNQLILNIDGTFFDKEKGYKRIGEPKEIPEDSFDSLELDLFFSQYSANTLFNALYNKELKIFDSEMTVTFKPKREGEFIEFNDNKVTLKQFAGVIDVKYGGLDFSLDFILNGMFIMNLISVSDLYVELKIITIDFDKFEFNSNIPFVSVIAPYVKIMVEKLINVKDTFNFNLPQFQFPYNVTLAAADIKVLNGFARASADLNFNIK